MYFSSKLYMSSTTLSYPGHCFRGSCITYNSIFFKYKSMISNLKWSCIDIFRFECDIWCTFSVSLPAHHNLATQFEISLAQFNSITQPSQSTFVAQFKPAHQNEWSSFHFILYLNQFSLLYSPTKHIAHKRFVRQCWVGISSFHYCFVLRNG